MSRKFDDFLNEQLNDAEIRSKYDALQPKHTLIQTMIDAWQELSYVIPEN
jgi:XRE family transcriptional regulator